MPIGSRALRQPSSELSDHDRNISNDGPPGSLFVARQASFADTATRLTPTDLGSQPSSGSRSLQPPISLEPGGRNVQEADTSDSGSSGQTASRHMEFIRTTAGKRKRDEQTNATETASGVQEPERLLCPISSCMFRDPVFNSVGNTYDRDPLLASWETSGVVMDPLTARPCTRTLIINWDKRRDVEAFLQEHPDYVPEGWTGRSTPALPRDALPGGFNVDDVVVSLFAFRGECGRVVAKGDIGAVLGEADVEKDKRIMCKFPNEPRINVFPREITRHNLPGGYVVGDVVVSLICHGGPVRQISRGDVGTCIGEATVDRAERVLCRFPNEPRINMQPWEITRQNLPGGYRVGDSIVSLIDFQQDQRSVKKGDVGLITGEASVDREFRVRCQFPNEPSINMYPREIAKRKLQWPPSLCCHRVVRGRTVRLDL